MPPKMPKSLRQGGTDIPVCLSAFLLTNRCTLRNSSLSSTQNQNHRSHQCLHPDQPRRMRQILRKKKYQRARNSQITQRDILERPASRPRRRQFPPRERTKTPRLLFDAPRCSHRPGSHRHATRSRSRAHRTHFSQRFSCPESRLRPSHLQFVVTLVRSLLSSVLSAHSA